MKLYESGPVDWFYDGWKTEDEMHADKRFKTLFDVPCVLFDNGKGKAYRFTALETLCTRWAVPYTGNADADYDNLIAAMSGTYKAPGAAEAQATADEAKSTADTAAASVDEYMDALLGLGATDETEATDAE